MHPNLKRAVIAAAAATALTGGVVAASVSASAATMQCAAAVTAPGGNPANQRCASQELTSLHLMLASPNKLKTYARLTVKAASTTNGSEDISAYPPATAFPAGSGGPAKVLDPRMACFGLCIAISNKGSLPVAKTCNGSASQVWTPATGASGGVQWVGQDGLAITDPVNGPAYTRLVLATPIGANDQSFTYTQSKI